MGKLALVLGCLGFIGSETMRRLHKLGWGVIGVDSCIGSGEENLEFYEYRLGQLSDVGRVFQNDFESWCGQYGGVLPDVVVNCAAVAGVRASFLEPHRAAVNNYSMVAKLLEWMDTKGIRFLVQSSTSSVYAGHNPPFSESAKPGLQLSPYSASKLAAENLIRTWALQRDIRYCVLRYFTVVGPLGRRDMLLQRLIESAIDGREVEIYGNRTRSFTDVRDVAEANVAAANSLFTGGPAAGQTLNIGNPSNVFSVERVIALVDQLAKKNGWGGEAEDSRLNLMRMNEDPADMPETDTFITKAQNCLRWTPHIDLEQTIFDAGTAYEEFRECTGAA